MRPFRDGTKYDVTYHLVNAADYGVPQKRERVIIVGFRCDLSVSWTFPKPSHSEDVLLWDKYVTGNYRNRHHIANPESKEVCNTIRNQLMQRYGMWPPELKPCKTMRDAFEGLGEPNGHGEHSLREGARAYPGHTGSDIDGAQRFLTFVP